MLNLSFLSIAKEAFTVGTPFVATVSNDWNLGVTWGNPGNVAGVDYPGLANDVWTINATIVVKYNVSSIVELGNGTVNGTLWFPLNATTLLAFGDANLAVGVTGSMFTSSDGTVGNIGDIGVGQTCTVTFNPTADNTKGVTIANGAYIQMRGNSTVYGGTHSTTLFSNWNAGQTLTATGAAPLSWTAGQTFTIPRNTLSGVATFYRFTIFSVVANGANTDITITEAAPAVLFVAGGHIEYEERNLMFRKVTALLPAVNTIYTFRPRVLDSHITGTVIWRNARFTGFYEYQGGGLQTGGTFEISDCIIRNGLNGFNAVRYCAINRTCAFSQLSNYGFTTLLSCVLTDCVCAYNFAGYFTLTLCTLVGCFSYSNSNYGYQTLVSCALTSCTVYSAGNFGFYNLTACFLTSCISYSNSNSGFFTLRLCSLSLCKSYSNTFGGISDVYISTLTDCSSYGNGIGFLLCDISYINGYIGYNGAVSTPNTVDFALPANLKMQNTKAPLAGFVFSNRNTPNYTTTIICEDYDQVPQSWRVYKGFSTITKIASPAGFRSANCLLVEPLSNISTTLAANIWNWVNNGIAMYLPTSSVKISVFVYGENWVVFPTNLQLFLEVSYLAGASATRTAVKSVQVIAANNTPTELSVTIVPGQAGVAYARLYFGVYETNSTHRVSVDSVIGINNGFSDIFNYCDDGFKPIWNGRNIIFR